MPSLAEYMGEGRGGGQGGEGWGADSHPVTTKGVGPGLTLAWPGWKQPDIPVEVDTGRLESGKSFIEIELSRLS